MTSMRKLYHFGDRNKEELPSIELKQTVVSDNSLNFQMRLVMVEYSNSRGSFDIYMGKRRSDFKIVEVFS